MKAPILLVEDYEPNILVSSIYLQQLGYDYSVARSGQEAVEQACEHNFYAILMDVKMPGMDGLQATQMIREHEQRTRKPRTPIIGLTAHALVGDAARCRDAGMDDYISKPFQEADLMRALEQWTDIKKVV